MQKIASAGTSVFAAAITCSSSARPPTSCSTLGRLLLSRVPLPAAMMATAKPVDSMPAIFSRRNVLAPIAGGRIIEVEVLSMATNTVIPVSEYLRTSYSPDCDYVDGEVQERNMGEQDHSDLQTRIAVLLSAPDNLTSI